MRLAGHSFIEANGIQAGLPFHFHEVVEASPRVRGRVKNRGATHAQHFTLFTTNKKNFFWWKKTLNIFNTVMVKLNRSDQLATKVKHNKPGCPVDQTIFNKARVIKTHNLSH